MTENILNPKLPLLNLDVQKQQEWAAPAQLMTQGDKGYVQPFTLSQNWTKYQVDTTNLGLRFSKPDGNVYDSGVTTSPLVTETGLTSAGFKTYEIELPKELTQVPGTVTAYIYAANSAGTIVASSNRFTYQVLPEFSADPASTTYIKGLDEIRNQLDGYLDKIKTLSDSYNADKDAIVANLKKQAQQWLSQEQDELSQQLTDEQQKLSDLSQKYTDKYNQLISQLPDADTAITQKINKELADIQKQAQDALKGVDVDLSKYELKSDLTEKLNTINQALEKAISIDDVNRLLISYATKADLDKKADKAELSNYATKDELKAIQPGAPDLSSYETKTDHASDINNLKDALEDKANASDLTTYETKADAKKALDAKANVSDLTSFATKDELAAKADTTALAGYATKTDLDAKANVSDLATYATKDDLKTIQPGTPDLSGYETTTAHQKDIDDINEALKGKASVSDLSTYATKTDLDTKADKTVLAGYATKTDLDTKADKTALDAKANVSDLTAYETKADAKKALDTKANVSDLANYATKTDLATKADMTALAGYATKNDLEAKANTSDLAAYETKAEAKKALDTKANVSDLSAYATKDDLKTIQPGAPDLSGYETTTAHKKDIDDINEALKGKADATALSDLATKADLDEKANKTDMPDTSQFATKTDLDTKADKAALAGYATKTDLDTKADKTALDAKANVSDLTAYETKEDAKKALDTKANASDLASYATKEELATKADTASLAGYATKTELDTKADKTALDAKANTADLASYATKDELKAKADAASLAGYATKDDLKNIKPVAPDLSSYETKADHANDIKAVNNKASIALSNANFAAQISQNALHSSLHAIRIDNKAEYTSDRWGTINLPLKLDSYAKKTDIPDTSKTDLSAYETTTAHKKDIDTINNTLKGKADVSNLATFATKDDLKKPQPFIDERNTPYIPTNGNPLTSHGKIFEQYVMQQGPDAVNNHAGRYLNLFNNGQLSTTFNETMLNGLSDGSFSGLQVGQIWHSPATSVITSWTSPASPDTDVKSIVAGVNCLGDQITSADGKKTYKNYVVMLGLTNAKSMARDLSGSSFKLAQFAGNIFDNSNNFDISNYSNIATLEKPDTSINQDAKAGDGSLTINDPFSEVTADIGAYLKAAYGDYLGTIRKNIFTGYSGDDGMDGSAEFKPQSQYKNYYVQLLNQKMIYGQDMVNSAGTQAYYRLNIDSDWRQLPLFRMQSKAIDNIGRVLGRFNFWLRDLSITRPKDDDNSSTVIRPVVVNDYINRGGLVPGTYSYPAPYVADENNHAAPVVFYYVLVNPNEK